MKVSSQIGGSLILFDCSRRTFCRSKRPFRNSLSGVQFLEQDFGLLQIKRVEAFREPAINRSKQFTSLLRVPLVAPEAREAHCGAQFPGLGILLARDGECAFKMRLRFRGIMLWRKQRYLASDAIDFGLAPRFTAYFHNCCRFNNAPRSVYELADFAIGVSK